MTQINCVPVDVRRGRSLRSRLLFSCYLVLVLATSLRIAEASQAWSIENVYLGANAGWIVDMNIDPLGQLHAGFYTENNQFQYLARQGGVWISQQTFSGGNDLALDNLGRPSVLAKLSAPFNLSRSTKQDDGTWTPQTVAPAPVSSTMRLAFDSLNRPNVAFVNTQAKELRLASFNGSSWDTRPVASGSEFQFGNSDFVFDLDSSDRAHFAWRNSTAQLIYAKPSGDSWQVSGVAGISDAYPDDLQVDSAGNVHLSFDLFTGQVSTGGLHHALFDGSAWSAERINGLLGFASSRSKIAIDAQGSPHLFTLDGGFSGPDMLKHVYWSNSGWQIELIDQWNDKIDGPESLSVAVGQDGIHVLYATGLKNVHHAFLAVPEPSTLALAGVGFAALWITNRRRAGRRR